MIGLMKKNKMNILVEYLSDLIKNDKIELNYEKDYELVIVVMLSAQTTDKRVNQVSSILFEKYNSLEKLANAELEDIKTIIKPIGTFNKKSANIILIAKKIIENGGVKNDRKFLESLPGVGRKTTNIVLNNLFDEAFIAVDTHVSRVSWRLGFSSKTDSPDLVEKKLTKLIPKDQFGKMHHRLVLFGRYYCTARSPKCSSCGLRDICMYRKSRD